MATRVAFAQIAAGWQTQPTTITLPSVSWQAGDLVLVFCTSADQGSTFATPTGGPAAFTAIGSPVTATSSCWGHKWQATASSNGSGAIQLTGGSGSLQAGAFVEVWRNHGGVGNHVAVASTAKTLSLTRAGNNSAVTGIMADWAAGATPVTWTPVSANASKVDSNGGGVSYSVVATEWPNEGTAGSASYGVSAGLSGAQNISKLFVEVLDAPTPISDPQWIARRPGPGRMGPIDPLKWEPWVGHQYEPPTPYPVDFTVVTGSGTSTTALALSPQAKAGDMLVVWLTQAGAQAITSTTPSSLVMPPGAQATNVGNSARLTALYCVLTAGDISTGTIVINWAATQRYVLVGAIVRNHAGVVDVVGSNSTGNTVSSVTVPAATPSYANELIMGAVGGQVNTVSTDITWSGWGPLAEWMEAVGTGAVNRAFLTVAFNPMSTPASSGPDSPVPAGSTISYAAFRLTIPIAVPASVGPSAATIDSTTADDFAAGSKIGVTSAVDSTTPADSLSGSKLATRATTDSVTPSDRPAGSKAATRALADSTTPADRPAGSKAASGATSTSGAINDTIVSARAQPTAATVESATPSDRPAGSKLAARSTADSGTPADRPSGAKLAAKTLSDSTTPTDRPAGSKLASRATTDSVTPSDRPLGFKSVSGATSTSTTANDRPIGAKSVARATVDSNPVNDSPLKTFARSGATSTAASPASATTGTKIAAKATVDSSPTSDRPAVGSKTVANASIDSTTPTDRPTGIKRAIQIVVEAVTPSDRPAGTKRGIGATRSECVPLDFLVGSKRAAGPTRTSTTPDDWASRGPTFRRNVTIHGGSVMTGNGPGRLPRPSLRARLSRYAPGRRVPRSPGGEVSGNP